MPLFHPSVLEKKLKTLSEVPVIHAEILSAWSESLLKGKFDRETSHDSEFIQRILIEVLGYKGSSSGATWTVAKNQPVGSGNVDVALGNFGTDEVNILAPFELKGAKTRDLDAIIPGRNKSPVQQAWEYAMDAKGAKWVLVSNYREIRLYAIGYGRKDYEQFNLLSLKEPKNYARFMLVLSADNLLGTNTLNLLKESENKEKEITDNFYKHYHKLRISMIETLEKDNKTVPIKDIIQYTQTILDRILFVAFAEDRSLLPEDTLKNCFEDRNKWNPQPAWENFKGLFRSIDKGNPPLKIPGYNGGLFAENSELNSLVVSDALCEGFKVIGGYDFESEVSVNILGHVFEQSISDLEEIKAKIEGGDFDLNSSKRKKDGIFYTPPHVTRYIVEQSIGGWLSDRRKEIGFEKLPELNEDDYLSIQIVLRGAKKGTVIFNKRIEQHVKAWEKYKDILTNIKVLDPACGSGAFLNEVFDYLYKEGQTINNELANFNAGQINLFRWDKHILANNIYGVDLNPESVEITKLSLWLKTANKNEKLTYLDDSIKCGNSLIDDPKTSKTSAFNWQTEFPQIFDNGGFDVIVGNPPYGAILPNDEITWLSNNYKSFEYQVNTYVLFYELGITLLNEHGILGYITPATFTYQHYFKNIRSIINGYELKSICKYTFAVFEDADVGDTVSFVLKKTPRVNKSTLILSCQNKTEANNNHIEVAYINLFDSNGIYNLTTSKNLNRIFKNSLPLGKCADIVVGIKPYQTGKGRPKQTKEIVEQKPFTTTQEIDSSYKLCVIGSNFHRYKFISKPTMFLKYGEWLAEPRMDAPFFDDEKIIIRQTADQIIANLDPSKSLNLNNVYNVGRPLHKLNLKYILGILNSSLIKSIYQTISQEKGKLFAEVKKIYLEQLPIMIIEPKKQQSIIEKVEQIILQNQELFNISNKFLTLLKNEFGIDKLTEKLTLWHQYPFKSLIDELGKKKINLTLAQKSEWMDVFEKQGELAKKLKKSIDDIDSEINNLVFELYKLTDSEILIAKDI